MNRLSRALHNPKSVPSYFMRVARCKMGEKICASPEGYKGLWNGRSIARYSTDLEKSIDSICRRATDLAPELETVLREAYECVDFSSKVKSHANCLLEGRTYVLGDYRSLSSPETREFWLSDYVTGYAYAMTYHSIARDANRIDNQTDIKRIWEIARMQYLLAPSLQYWLSKDEVYARVVVRHIEAFLAVSPYDYGPLWQPSMEVGIRLTNMILAFCFIADSESCTREFVEKFRLSAAQHVEHLRRFPENLGGLSSNHHLGSLMGRISYSMLIDENGSERFANLMSELKSEARKQILWFGADYEGSTSYHRLVGEMLSLSFAMLALRGCLADEDACERMAKAVVYSRMVSYAADKQFQIGDNDSGRAIQLIPDRPNSTRAFRGLALAALRLNRYARLDELEKSLNNCMLLTDKIAVVRKEYTCLAFTAFDCLEYGMGDHCHNDLLSFVFSVGGNAIVVDPGTGSYTGNPKLRNDLRSIHSHSSVSINGLEQRELVHDRIFGWGKGYGKSKIACVANTEETVDLIGETDCFKSRTGCRLRREVLLKERSRSILIHDEVDGEFERLSLTIPLHPDAIVKEAGSGYLVKNGSALVGVSGTWEMLLSEMIYSSGYDRCRPTKCLIAKSTRHSNDLRFTIIENGSSL